MLDKMLQWLLSPRYMQEEDLSFRRTRFLAQHLMITSLFTIFYYLFLSFLGYTQGIDIMLPFIWMHLFCFLLLRLGVSRFWIGNLFSLGCFIVVTTICASSEGISSPAMGWYFASQVSGFWFASRQSGYFWLLMTLIAAMCFSIVEQEWGQLFVAHGLDAQAYGLYASSAYLGLLFYCAVVLYNYERWQSEARGQLEEQHGELLSAHEELIQHNEEIIAQRELLTQKSNELQAYHRYISASINYASRIQRTVLGDADEIGHLLGKAFTYWVPRDTVSGDFYWYAEVNSRKIIVAADCTGHGVPGAFMTLLATNLLRNVVYEQGLWQPDRILQALDEAVKQRTYGQDGVVSDGLDLSILVLDEQRREILFAGANHPLWCISQGRFTEISGDAIPIGRSRHSEKHFTLYTLPMVSGDRYYLFSDGYRDQFGGWPVPSRFLRKRFRQLITQISAEPMERQPLLLEQALQQWKGDEKQTDDILVMGIEIL